jgi:hypothetical protein
VATHCTSKRRADDAAEAEASEEIVYEWRYRRLTRVSGNGSPQRAGRLAHLRG